MKKKIKIFLTDLPYESILLHLDDRVEVNNLIPTIDPFATLDLNGLKSFKDRLSYSCHNSSSGGHISVHVSEPISPKEIDLG